mmetsp:Transcript_22366/g.52238  ORF Transcript_22366/g.52238 Transcript_22366/m.52238 type:complete len:299 (-) Transcript_22366:104-1000(-)
MTRRVFRVAVCTIAGAAALADTPEDHVPLIQRMAQSKVSQAGSAGDDNVLLGYLAVLRLQYELVDFLLPKASAATELVETFPWATPFNWSTEANPWAIKPWNWSWPWALAAPAAKPSPVPPPTEQASAEAKPLPLSEEGMCTPADHAHSKAKVTEYMSKKGFKFPPSCPVVKELSQVLPSLNQLGPCLAELLDISPGCADCHQALVANLPSCLPTCGMSVFSCPIKFKGGPDQKCWSAVGDCLSCAAPFYIQNFKCTGDVPKAAYKLIDEFVADVSDGSFAKNGTALAFLTHVVSAFR